MRHCVRQLTRVLRVRQTSHGKETVDGGLSQSHLAIWDLQAGYPAPDKTHGKDCEISLLLTGQLKSIEGSVLSN